MAVKPPMKLQFKENENGKNRIFLDGKEIHHVREYKIESSAYVGKAELSIKMLVQIPVNQESTSQEVIGMEFNKEEPWQEEATT